jgi:hypothetical protein
MKRRAVLASLGAVALAGTAGLTAEPDAPASPAPTATSPVPVRPKRKLEGVAGITVAELAAALRKEGFQWRFVARLLEFKATVVSPRPHLEVRIHGLDEDFFDTAVLHNARPDQTWKVGDQLRVEGLIVDQWYGVWQIWEYSATRVDA